MEVFFVLSGYLVGNIVISNAQWGSDFYRAYFIRRSLRIWPVYFLVLPACIVLHGFLQRIGVTEELQLWPRVAQTVLFLQNLELTSTLWSLPAEQAGYPVAFTHTWSVALEEQFYLCAAVLIPILISGQRNRHSRLRACLVLAVLFSFVIRVLGADWIVLIARMDGFALGVLLASRLDVRRTRSGDNQRAAPRDVVCACWVGGVTTVCFIVASYFVEAKVIRTELWGNGYSFFTLFYSAQLLASAVMAYGLIGICVSQAECKSLKWLRAPWARYFGEISYSTYMWHPLVLLIFSRALSMYVGVHEQVALILAAVIAIGVSHLSFQYIESPFLRLGRKFSYGPRPARVPGNSRETQCDSVQGPLR